MRYVISIYRGVLNNYGTSIDAEERKSAVERQGTDTSSVDTGSPSASESSCATATACDSDPDRSEEQLPPGWEKHEGIQHSPNQSNRVLDLITQLLVDYRLIDDDGPYYWHIKSGTIQREPPENKDSSSQPAMNFQRQVVREAEVGSLTQPNAWSLLIILFFSSNINKAISASFTPVVPRSTTSFTLSDLDSIRSKEDMAFKYNF